jgi:leader peptidase (prepilin peptidase)/N-methyltransferase
LGASELLFFFILGAVFGSFGNVLIARVPKGENIVKPASHCPACQTPIKPWHNIPLLSWIWLRGKCAACGAPISLRYPLVEGASGVLFVAVFWAEGLSIFALFTALSFFLLLVLAAIDLEYKAVPDHINLPALILALLSSPFFLENLEHAVLMAGGMALLRFFVSWMFSKEAMGEADIIVGATMGALLGVSGSLTAIFAASLLALPVAIYGAVKGRDPEIPFIPFLVAATMLVYFLGGYLLIPGVFA